ncbi:MAG: hypothetical protein K0Q87_1596 [Neobacillus sp.]|nr:hypothetical protein [Neobacillus sp.]
MNYEACFTSMENIEQVVKETTFQYSEWKQYINHRGPMYKTEYGSMIPFFDLAAKYPCIEYLTKMGFKSMVEDKLYGGKTYGAIYWRGKRIDKVLRLNKQEIKGLMASNVKEKNCALLYSYHYFRKKGMRLSYERAKELEELIYRGTISNETFNSLLRKIEFKKLINYLLKQLDKRRKSKYGSYESVRNVLITLKDYHNDCNELGIELNNEWDLFPSDLYPRHEKLTKRLKIKHDKELNERIKQNLKLIKHLNYSLESLFIRPAASSEELFAEGKALNHCVGGYAARYSIGDTIILFIRRFDQPELPFYTVEVQGNRVIQVRGDHNCSPTKEVQAFLDAFKQEKLKKKKVKGAA